MSSRMNYLYYGLKSSSCVYVDDLCSIRKQCKSDDSRQHCHSRIKTMRNLFVSFISSPSVFLTVTYQQVMPYISNLALSFFGIKMRPEFIVLYILACLPKNGSQCAVIKFSVQRNGQCSFMPCGPIRLSLIWLPF